MAIPTITIIDISDKYAIGIWRDTDKKMYFDPTKLPDNISLGDKFYHIEHGYCDVYDINGRIKISFINFRKAMIPSADLNK